MAVKPDVNTGFRSLTYRSGKVYNFLTYLLYNQEIKFKIIGNLIGNHSKEVLDLPCGTGLLTRHLHPSIKYFGFDVNHRFLKKIQKDYRKGKINLQKVVLKQKNIFNYKEYGKEKDVIVFCDILHHVYPRHIELVENAKNYAKKIIICEPVAVRPSDMNGHDLLAKITIQITKHFPEKLLRICDYFFGDNDGINTYEERSTWPYNKDTIIDLYNSFGITEQQIYQLDDEFIGVWEKK
ncbi:MAG: methyltransferase domain-containing protein [Candidatus Lokiarchaeota archaeon]|nr:methyltransferase domain-containing protein [Candidatus Lokiarchaeota archaeon]